MRNLRLLKYKSANWCSGVLSEGPFLSVDQDTGDVYVASTTLLSALSLSEKTAHEINLENEGIESQPIGLQYLCDQQAVCIATKDGQIWLWEKGREQMECVGEVPQGLTSMAWSPDLELLVITTANNTLILMTREFDPITELPLFADHSAEETPVSVGWGKKETQFHGSAGKEAAKKTAEPVQPVGEDDPGTVCVRWRGDGQFFVVNAIDSVTGARSLYVWSRECIFQSKSEVVNGLQHLLDWKPSGSLIASVQTKAPSNLQDVVFFEKNGLRHGQFPLTCGQTKSPVVRKLSWNQDSTVLCLWLQDVTNQSSEVRLMTVNNYHWYQKQSLQYSYGLSVVEWDPEHPYKLYVGSGKGLYTYSWTWDVCCTPGTEDADLASVAVIDGDKLLVTPMRRMVVPPPMAAFTLTFPSQVNFATFDPSPISNAVAALMADGTVALYEYQDVKERAGATLDAAGGDGFTPKCDTPTLTRVLTFDKNVSSAAPVARHHLLWLGKTRMLYVTTDECGDFSHVHIGDLLQDDGIIVDKYSVAVEELVIGVALSEQGSHVAIQLESGSLHKLDVESETILPWECDGGEVSFPYPCMTMSVAEIRHQQVVLGLTDKFRFYVNGTEVASNCTSFALHNDFLLLSTMSHTVRCIDRSTKVSELPKLSDGKEHPFDESIRRVERGSKIVTVVADDTKLVLQMPRGNLETIHPRALVLSTLKRLLSSFQIKAAFSMMRKHRVNLNLFYDHNPDSFVNNVDSFIDQMGSVTYLNLFITELVEDDITRTMYTASYQRGKEEKKSATSRSKVDLVCNTLLDAFKRLGEHTYFLSVLTAHVKKTSPEFEQALLKIWSLQGGQTQDGGCTASEALKYLLILVDVNTMYYVALGTYNFDLVMMVAQQSQKDPKEYIPFLNDLRRLEENYRRYTIDKHLKKYSSALEHIAKCGDDHFEESTTLVCEHKLYSKALRLYKTNRKHFQLFASLYGEYLKSKNRHDEAGVMFVKAEKWNLALDCFRADYDWQQVFCMAARLEYTSNQTSELAQRVAEEIKQRQRFSEAATVYEDYAQNPEEAIACLIEGSHWSEAMRMMHRHSHLDLIETHLLEALTTSYDQHTDLLSDQKELFDKHKNRLEVVRMEKEKQHRLMLEGISEYNDAEADLFSDTTSITGASVSSHRTYDSSRSTVFSKATSKSKRKGGSNKWSLKEGSTNEEFALIEALAKTIKYIDSLKDETNHLLKALMQFNFDEKAFSLQETYADFLAVIQSAIPEIWTSNSSTDDTNSLGPNTTANTIAMAMQRQRMNQDDAPKLDPVLCVPPTLNKDTRWKLHMAGDQDR